MLIGLMATLNSFGQGAVDPETFPTLNVGIGSKYLYTNTGGEGKILVDDIIVGSIDTVAVTYSEFYSLITSNQLIGGNTYILMDFQTIYDQMDFDNTGALKGTLTTKTGAVEQIWVLALSPNQIADKAYSATYPNDEIQYDWTYNTTLVNGAPAKGRISERIDEWNNRTDYDHREIKFIRYDDGAGNFTVINDNGNASQEFLTFGNNYGAGGIIHDNWLGDFYSIGQFFGQEYSNNVFQGGFIMSNKITSVFYNNTSLSDFIVNVFLNETTRCIFGGTAFSGNLVSGGFYDVSLTNGNVSNSLFNGYFTNIQFNGAGFNNLNSFEGIFENIVFDCIVSSCTFNNIIKNTTFTGTNLEFTNVYGRISGKTIDDVTYPNLFNTYYEKKIFNASDNNVYFRYFDGTNDVNTLIP